MSMEHTKKMYLVPQELFQLIEEKRVHQVAPLTKKVGDLNQQLEETLQRSDLAPDKQMKLFDQQAQQWQTYQEKQNQPLPMSLSILPQDKAKVHDSSKKGAEGGGESHLSKDSVAEDVLESIPKSMKVKAKWLLQRIKRSDVMGWTDKGELVMDGAPVPGTHLVDLINDVVRKRKTTPNATGWQEFAAGLRRLHVPQEVVGNSDRWDYIMMMKTHPGQTLLSKDTRQISSLTKTKKKRNKSQKKASKHQEVPLRWEPY